MPIFYANKAVMVRPKPASDTGLITGLRRRVTNQVGVSKQYLAA